MTIGRHSLKLAQQKIIKFPSPSRILLLPTTFMSTTSTVMAATEKFNFNDVFSLQNKQRTIDVLSQLSPNVLGSVGGVQPGDKLAAVLVPMCYDTGRRPAILYNLRSESLSLNKGDISFPGGSMDEGDEGNIITTALRETEEELGMDPKKVEIWTTLPSLPSVRTSLKVIPVLGLINESIDAKLLKINPDEVQYAFTIPLDHLCHPDNWSMTHIIRNNQSFTMPAYKNLEQFLNTKDTKVQLWGLTAIITHICLSTLVHDVYQRDLDFPAWNSLKPKI